MINLKPELLESIQQTAREVEQWPTWKRTAMPFPKLYAKPIPAPNSDSTAKPDPASDGKPE